MKSGATWLKAELIERSKRNYRILQRVLQFWYLRMVILTELTLGSPSLANYCLAAGRHSLTAVANKILKY